MPEPTVVYPTVASVEKDIADKTQEFRAEMRHLKALLRVLKDREKK